MHPKVNGNAGRSRMPRSLVLLLALFLAVLGGAAPLRAEDRFGLIAPDPGRSSRQVAGKITGFDTVTWALPVAAGQTVGFSFETNHPESVMDVFGPDGRRLHEGAADGTTWSVVAAAPGQYAARLLLGDRAARRGETVTYRLTATLTGEPVEGAAGVAADAAPPAGADGAEAGAAAPGAPAPSAAADPAAPAAAPTAVNPAATDPAATDPAAADPAAAGAGSTPPAEAPAEPDPEVEALARSVAPGADFMPPARFWAVTGVPPGGVLPVLESPGKEATRIGELAHDAVGLENRGCRMVSAARWCRVELAGKRVGWVAGRYLRETSREKGDAEEDETRPGGARPLETIAGVVRCAQGPGLVLDKVCEARVQRAGPGLAVVHATLPDGTVRAVNFAGDRVFTPNPGLVLEWQFKGTSYEIVINGSEKFVIPAAVIGGG